MSSDSSRRRAQYSAEIGGASCSRGPKAEFGSIRDARARAEAYRKTADWCEVKDVSGKVVGTHRRSGDRWRWWPT
ncbi:hypothetical protein A33M_1893 [Rhodovulum sp. PH10]|uniref:hypothetical protein n=1 Tax=Rhodovulum sp. PH10 TaxID=1187851 RepID=UPI00027C28CD|nr:hypothetical protein [Rhodovulum sp. PH10]EJW12610.1 hypothetical protein A33M_1893 [Rhodovulum sp. PH10]